jgi:hypothetical protein
MDYSAFADVGRGMNVKAKEGGVMKSRFPYRALLATCAGLLSLTSGSLAQGPGASGSTSGLVPQQPLGVQMYGTMGGMNPYLNPYMMGSQGNSDYLLYMYAKNQQAGGIGSGVISGTRPAPGVPAGSAMPGTRAGSSPSTFSRNPTPGAKPAPARTTALLPSSAMSPVGNTGGYFQRGPGGNQAAARYYNRTQPARVQNNGR